jgi:3-oxoacyl-[acyl-carrier protein] reductase
MGNLFQNKVVLVTGSGQGVGRAIAIAFAAEGAIVVTNNRKPGSTGYANMTQSGYEALSIEKKREFDAIQSTVQGDAESTARTIINRGGRALPLYCDISKIDEVEKMVRRIVDTYGTVDILINVAGAFGGGSLDQMTETEWDRTTLIKPKGYFNVMKFVLPHMVKQHFGRIVNCTSKAFMGDIIKHAHYCAANAGVVGLTRGAACEYYHEGVTVNAFAPWARTRAAYENDFINPSGRAIPGQRTFPSADITPDPEALCPFILYLCTEHASEVTGTVFTLAGNEFSMHAEPVIAKTIYKPGKEYWSVEELVQEAPRSILRGYKNILSYQ